MRKWDCDTGLLVGKPWGSRGGSIYALALSPDGKTISCGRNNGSVEMWNTDGEMNEDIWTDHSSWVRALSWSPSGGHIASGSYDGTILIRKARNGELEPEVGPIETQQGGVNSLAYSDSGDRIASGGNNKTIWIWNSKTGEILVGPIEDVGLYGVISVVWSLDDSKLYSASDKSARVFDSTSGTELHRLQHNDCLYSVALSPKHNVLACVGNTRVAQLWDTESYRPLGRPFSQEDGKILRCVSFSRGYLAHSGDDLKITLWMVKDIAPELPVCAFTTIIPGDMLHNRTLQPSLHHRLSLRLMPLVLLHEQRVMKLLRKDAIMYMTTFFRHLEPPRPVAYGSSRSSHRPRPFSGRRLWNVLTPSRHSPPAESIPLQPRIKRSFFTRHAAPRPVTVSAARPKKLYWTAPRRVLPQDQSAEEGSSTNAETGQSSSAAAQSSSAAAPSSTPQGPQHLQAQRSTRPTRDDGYD
ncbi:WD40 repeat-like protein [Rhizopogon vinicolor AM-OR11-026]|uniref:WD40 repeat-like protein n=1 Tax=Rhizopogon vinicolor AM-OR11-026 TaxID=1314800 RepID=A0A1B7MPB5_9AGAM|nr:WD40 repeat-like protein [Rhizopogon vinicolor AM-OR11-026]